MKKQFEEFKSIGFKKENYPDYKIERKSDQKGFYDNSSILNSKTNLGFMVVFNDNIYIIELVYVSGANHGLHARAGLSIKLFIK
jgi:hypothetical protein